MIDIIKKLSGEQDETIIQFHIKKACMSIRNYLNKTLEDAEIIASFESAVIQAVVNSITNMQNKNVKSMTQGQRALTFSDNILSLGQDVKDLLPKPYMRLL